MQSPPTESDHYRIQTSKILKSLLLKHPPHSLYQLEYFYLTGATIKSGCKDLAGFVWNRYVRDRVVDVAKAVVAGLGVVGCGVGVGLAVVGLVVGCWVWDRREVQSLESKLKLAIQDNKLKQTLSIIQSYQSCLQLLTTTPQHYHTFTSNPQNLQTLTSLKYYLLDLITKDEQFPKRPLDLQIDIVALFYRLSRIVVQVLAATVGDAGRVRGEIEGMRGEHGQVRKVVVGGFGGFVDVGKTKVVVKGLGFQFVHRDTLLTDNLMFNWLYEQIFKCPITGLPIQNIYNPQIWLKPHQATLTDIQVQQKLMQTQSPHDAHLGDNYLYNDFITAPENHMVREIVYNKQSGRWLGYFQSLVDYSGVVGEGCNYCGETVVDVGRVKALFYVDYRVEYHQVQRDEIRLVAIDYDHNIKVLRIQPYKTLPISVDYGYIVQFNNLYYIKQIQTHGPNNLKFNFAFNQLKLQKKTVNFEGFIATVDKKYRLGIGYRGFSAFLHADEGFTFFAFDKNDSQSLIYSCVTPISCFEDGKLKEFTCKISTKKNRDIYMGRDDRNKQNSVLGTTKYGEQLVKIILTKKLGECEYIGKLQIISKTEIFETYLSGSNNLKWTRKSIPQGKQTLFYFIIEQ